MRKARSCCWQGIWRPLGQMRQDTAAQRDRKRIEMQWRRGAASEVARLTAVNPVSRQDRGNQSLLALAEQTARQAGLGNAFRGGEPAAEGQVRIRLEGAQFGALLTWLDTLESEQGIGVIEGNLERTGIPGLVTARLLLNES